MASSAMVSVLLAELTLHAFFHSALTPIFQLDDRYLFSLVPGATKVFTRDPSNGGQSISVKINSRGFRGEEIAENNDTTRIVVYGDSMIAAEFSAREDTFTGQLESRLREAGQTSVEVINGLS